MKWLGVVVAASTALVSAEISSSFCSFESNVDYPGNDITFTYRDNANDCIADCQATAECKLFVWHQGQCWLKRSQSPQTGASETYVCILPSLPIALQPGVDYHGNDITFTNRALPSDCIADCQATSGCKLFVWYQGQCWLKNSQGEQSSVNGAVAGVLPQTSTCELEPNVDYAGFDISSTSRSDAKDCISDCQNTPNCKLFVWWQGQCYLKSFQGDRREVGDRVSCVFVKRYDIPGTLTPSGSSSLPTTVLPDTDLDEDWSVLNTAKLAIKTTHATPIMQFIGVAGLVVAVAAALFTLKMRSKSTKDTEERRQLIRV
ncbi:unnamed protein product [Aphanomyces euteiches]|uniref:Apple domain-containing protein n=1 Tax=Aphanomyces euteiches TaxID=100861 RepID=A0A6G0X5V2_9STRA|nr:hypothetical protein Ae201684_008145 [Aphanomyces euteiches]KAH9074614.1 hypothetical protein Ae201684P_022416 [Aphanomyces euteiches]KAH9153815.1 hypothetical protein AeRB84_003998 [Aphanomyces euteiches]